ncbi:hypothetical protein SEEE2558_24774 [Salmonella enterica subsp. enterica serovar Enteritidis str. 22558]|nr:hypothetical protein SEEE2558_24774 [Salmonella enterica subsp. enterica serovar Enteritidis str. 22558]
MPYWEKTASAAVKISCRFAPVACERFPIFSLCVATCALSFCQDASIPNPAYKQKTAGNPAAVAHDAF